MHEIYLARGSAARTVCHSMIPIFCTDLGPSPVEMRSFPVGLVISCQLSLRVLWDLIRQPDLRAGNGLEVRSARFPRLGWSNVGEAVTPLLPVLAIMLSVQPPFRVDRALGLEYRFSDRSRRKQSGAWAHKIDALVRQTLPLNLDRVVKRDAEMTPASAILGSPARGK